jgi:DNA-binding PadR family transcriptional regulator
MPKNNTTRFIILGLLQHEDLSGYDIKKKIDHMISSFWEVGYGQIYPTLKQLVDDELACKRTGTDSKGPEKNIYSITEKGRETLKEWLATPEEKEYTKYEILLKLFFGSLASKGDNINRIQTFRQRQEKKLELIQLFKSNLERVLGETDDHIYYYLTVLFGEKIYSAYIDWANEATSLLEGKDNNETKN